MACWLPPEESRAASPVTSKYFGEQGAGGGGVRARHLKDVGAGLGSLRPARHAACKDRLLFQHIKHLVSCSLACESKEGARDLPEWTFNSAACIRIHKENLQP